MKHSYLKHLDLISGVGAFLFSCSLFFKIGEVDHYKCCYCFMEKIVPQDRFSMSIVSFKGPTFYFLFPVLFCHWEISTVSSAELAFSISLIILYFPYI